MLSSSGPENIPGKSVSTSIFMLVRPPACDWCPSTVHQLKRTALSLLGAARLQQSANRVHRLSLTSDDPAGIRRIQPQFKNRLAAAFHRGHRHFVGILN